MLLKESAQTSLNGQDVGCANLGLRDYTGSDGVEREGMTAQLALAEETWVVVGEGSVFEAGGFPLCLFKQYFHDIDVAKK